MARKADLVIDAAKRYRAEAVRLETKARRDLRRAFSGGRDAIRREAERYARSYDARPTPNKAYNVLRQQALERDIDDVLRRLGDDSARLLDSSVAEGGRIGFKYGSAVAGIVGAQPMLAESSLVALRSRLQVAVNHMRTVPASVADSAASLIFDSVATGTPYDRWIQDLADIIGSAGWQAETVLRTETLTAFRSASQEAAAPFAQKYVWQAAIDGSTCPICWAMHGTEADIGAEFSTHPNCRCTVVPLVTGYEDDLLGIIGNGEERFAALSEDEQMNILGRGRYELYASGVPLSAMVRETYDPVWGGGRRLATLAELSDVL